MGSKKELAENHSWLKPLRMPPARMAAKSSVTATVQPMLNQRFTGVAWRKMNASSSGSRLPAKTISMLTSPHAPHLHLAARDLPVVQHAEAQLLVERHVGGVVRFQVAGQMVGIRLGQLV